MSDQQKEWDAELLLQHQILKTKLYKAQAEFQTIVKHCNSREQRIAELEAALKAIARHHEDCLMTDQGVLNNLMRLYHTERRRFALKALEGSKP